MPRARRWLPWLGLLLIAAAPGAVGAAEDDPFAEFEEEEWEDPWGPDTGGLTWTGFVEGALGARWDNVENLERLTLGEVRLRAETRYDREAFSVDFKGELNLDEVTSEIDPRLRELALSLRPASNMDAKLGRQVLTWGTGDLLFLNDLFPKDFISFFAGRDEDYLKRASDAARISIFSDLANLDIAWMPEFEPDEYLYGERFAFWNPGTGKISAPARPRRADAPSDDELALRLFRTVEGTEYALYGYLGRWKQPLGVDEQGGLQFPRLHAWGASIRLPLHEGLFNAEAAWYDSRDDGDGDDPAVPNSELRMLLGYEQELVRNLTAGTQLYAERIQHHDRLIANSPDPQTEREQWRSVVTLRLTHRALQDTLSSSFFIFLSPSDEDFYMRPSVAWRRDDQWLFSAGVNIFGGREDYTFFGQLEDNSNAWVRIRYHY